jgi:tetratricopeptide (TPR) repeat protein
VYNRLGYRVETWIAEVRRSLAPEEQVVFVPQEQSEQVEAIVQATLQALIQPTPPPIRSTPTNPPDQPALTPTTTPPPTPTPTAIPDRITLEGIRYQHQTFNNCGPANLAMALSFWGWNGDQADTRAYLRPNLDVDDKNIMPEEMVRYVETQTGLKALMRVNGNLDLLKRFLALGFPLIIEKGHHPPDDWWMGHFMVINAYNDNQGRFTAQDSLIQADAPLPYDELDTWWRDFNYVYIVIYPAERQAEVLNLLGPDADPAANFQGAAARARQEVETLKGRDRYFAWFNLGSSLVALGDYAPAAQAYDQAFTINAGLPDHDRLHRMIWYQVGPYIAYTNSGRYQDVLDLGNATLTWLGKTTLEETLYWMGMAREATGDLDKAIQNYTRAAELNPNYEPPRQALQRLGQELP